MANALNPYQRITVETLLARGLSHRQISRETGVHRGTIARIASKCTSPAILDGQQMVPIPERRLASSCEPHREWIEEQVALGRNAMAIYQHLVDDQDFRAKYNSVKRFVRGLRKSDPERYDVLDFLPGEESQVDYGQGAPTLRPGTTKYKRPYLFVMTLRFSRKSYRQVVWKTSQSIWAQLHMDAWRALGGTTQYVVLDNLKEGVIAPDLYDPKLNPVYASMLSHYGVVGDPCRVRDPNRKGSVESDIKYTQSTALNGRRFESLEAQNEHLRHWEERWASQRTHGRAKRKVLDMYEEEKPHLQPLPVDPFQMFTLECRTVDDMGCVVINDRYYSALPARLRSKVSIKVFSTFVEILSADGEVVRRHEISSRRGSVTIDDEDRVYNPSRETSRLLERIAQVGPVTKHLADSMLAQGGRPSIRQIYGLSNLTRAYTAIEIEGAARHVLEAGPKTCEHLKRLMDMRRQQAPAPEEFLAQSGNEIREIGEYAAMFDHLAKERRST